MEVTMNKLNYCFHDHKAKRESYNLLSLKLLQKWQLQ